MIERSATLSGEEECTEVYTQTYIDDTFGGDLGACAEQGPNAESVEISDVSGVDEISASATAELTGGRFSGESFELHLIFDAGTWKINTINTAAPAG